MPQHGGSDPRFVRVACANHAIEDQDVAGPAPADGIPGSDLTLNSDPVVTGSIPQNTDGQEASGGTRSVSDFVTNALMQNDGSSDTVSEKSIDWL